jgi:hypothetical protein
MFIEHENLKDCSSLQRSETNLPETLRSAGAPGSIKLVSLNIWLRWSRTNTWLAGLGYCVIHGYNFSFFGKSFLTQVPVPSGRNVYRRRRTPKILLAPAERNEARLADPLPETLRSAGAKAPFVCVIFCVSLFVVLLIFFF